VSSDRADRDARQGTVNPGPRANGADEAVGTTPQPPADDMTVVLPPPATRADQVVMDAVPQPPEDDMTVILPRLAWGAAPDQVVVGDIPVQPPGFQPRPTLLTQLDRAGRGTSAVRVLTGRRGVGKTQLAAAYARARLAAGWRLVAWINAADTASLRAGLAAVADAARLSDEDSGRDAADPGRAAWRRLEADGEGCLLVLDDVTDPETLRPFVPVRGAAEILITTSQPSVADLGTSVPVDAFSQEEALAVLAGRTGLADEEKAAVVAAEVGYLPLGLAHVAAVIARRHIDYETYLERLRAVRAEKYLTQDKERQPYPDGVAEAVLLSMEAVRTDDPAGVCAGTMEIMAVLSPAGVRRELVHAAGQSGALARRRLRSRVSAALVDQALARLAERSLLTFSLDGRKIIAHSLVMQVVRERLVRQRRLAAVCRAAASVVDTRAGMLARSPDRAAVRDITEQLTALRANAARLGAGTDAKLARVLLSLRLWVQYHLGELGDSASQAIAVGGLLAADFEREAGPDHPETLGSQNSHAAPDQATDGTAEAVALFEQILAIKERLLGPDHPDTLTAQNDLAAAYWDADRTAEAILVFERTLAARERQLGANHPKTLNSRGNLAAAYRATGRAAEAIPLFEQTLAGRERLLGPHHSATLTSRCHLASAYWDTGRVADAIPLAEQVLVARERLLGPDHPGTLAWRSHLAAAYRSAGRAADAIPLVKRILAARERQLGVDHFETSVWRNNLAAAYQGAGRAAEAIPLHEQTLAACERLLGPDHPRTLKSRDDLAGAYRDVGRAAEAIPLFQQTLATRQQLLGADHPDTLTTRNGLAAACREAGRAE
jgi:tetratricopeptide (TPR) repeat protein